MAKIKLKGNDVNTAGSLPKTGDKAPDFRVTKSDLSDVTLADLAGKKVILNIFPSVDTGICAASTRKFNEAAADLDNTIVVCVSRDLPFAHKRFCEAEGIKNVIAASEFKDTSFSDAYQVKMTDGPMQGIFSRAVVVVDEAGKVTYTEQVPEITQEPDYEKALNAVR